MRKTLWEAILFGAGFSVGAAAVAAGLRMFRLLPPPRE